MNGTQIFVDEQRYRSLFDLVQVAVYACDTNGVIQEFNGHAVKLWGRKPRLNDPNERFCGSYRMFYPDGRFMPHTQCPMARVLRGEKLRPGDLEIIVERADGERRQILAAPQVVRNERGEITGAINCFYDITDRKRTEYILTETARRQKILYEFVQQRSAAKSLVEIYSVGLDATINLLRCDRAAILLFDSDGVMRFKDRRGLSDRYCRAIEGHSPWISNTRKPEPICIADVDHADIPRKLKATIKAEGIRALAFVPLVAEKKLIGKLTFCFDAPRVLTDEELGLILNAAGQLALGIERKRVEEAFHESEERIRAIVEQTTVGMARAGRDGRILFTNKHFCKMLGYKDGELIGKSIRAFTHKDEAAKTSVLMARLIKHGKAYELEKRYVRKDGSVIWVNVSASPVRDARGRPHSVVAVVVDITARKKAEAALENSKTQLEKLVQQRTQALREANHELENEIQQR
ncbi:MAG: PAS domain S-box protein, partial [Verrucomicrobiota bacterium]